MSREKLLSTLDKSERNFKNLSQNGLEQITKMRRIKNYKGRVSNCSFKIRVQPC